MSDKAEMNCIDLLTLRLGAVFTLSDGEGSDGVLYVKSGNVENDIIVELLTDPGEGRRLGIREMDDCEARSTKYRVLQEAELRSLAEWLLDLSTPNPVKAIQ